ncbi:MAG: GAF domain-containing protein [Ardenticatenaceae bacterium]|nr:GAF domain-containing protein [Anaerolineales bacterium]MCB8923089.1 GAF domain-containing protein [Ardenticatenaceae bacterium]
MSRRSKQGNTTIAAIQQKVQALSEIVPELACSDSLENLYRQAVILGREKLEFDRLSLFLYDAATNAIINMFTANGDGQVREGVEDPQILDVLLNQNHSGVWEQTDDGSGEKWAATAVLRHNDQVIGWLTADKFTSPEPHQTDLLLLYSTGLGQAIINKQKEAALHQLQSDLHAKTESLTTINRIADTLYRSHDVSVVVQQASDFILEYTGAPSIAIFKLDPVSQTLQILASQGFTDDTLAVGSTLPIEGSLSGLTIKNKTIVTSNDLVDDDRLVKTVKKALMAQNLQTAVSIPMIFQDEVWGVINLLFEEMSDLSEQERETLLTIGKTIGLALNNAQRVAQIEEEIHDKELLEQQNQEALEIRNRQIEIGQAIANSQTEDEIVSVIVNRASYFPQAGIAVFLRETAVSQSSYTLVNRNPFDSGLNPMPIGSELFGKELPELLENPGPLIIFNADKDTRLSKTAKRMAKRSGIVSWAVFPLISAGERLGLLMCASQIEGFFQQNNTAVYQSLAEHGATALRAARLFQRTQETLARRSREVALSTQIAQEIAAATDLNDLYQRVVNQVQELFGYYHTQLLRFDPALETVALVYGYGDVGKEMLELNHSIPMNVGIIGSSAATGQSILRTNLHADTTWQPNPLLPNTKGELAVPIKLRDEVLGILDIQSDQVDKLDENDLLLLEGLCGQIAVAIESTRLRQEMESNLRELSTLQRYMSREAWQAYRQSRQNIIGYQFDQAGVSLLEKQQISESTANGEQDSLISTPLNIRGETIGSLSILDNPDDPLTEEELSFLQAVSQQVSEALEAARLFEQTQDALLEQERLTSELETVAQVSTAASTILEVDNLLQAVVDLARTSFDLYHAHIYMLDEETNALSLKAGAGNVGRLMTLEGRNIDVEAESIVARAARTYEVIVENDVQKVVDFLPHPLLPNTRAEMAVPMTVGNKLVGILDLQASQAGHFAEEDIKIQRTLASQIAVAVENAKLYAEQVETADKLRQVDQLKSEFLASMSHELRTPLNSIIGFADVLLEGLDGDLNERMEQDVQLIRSSGDHLRSLIGDILDMSKIEAGRMELRYEMVDMHTLAQDVLATAAPLAQEKNLALVSEISDSVEAIEADRTRIRQILWNITGNAIKFTEQGSVTLSMDVGDNDLVVSIRDTGIGIRPEDVPIVFEQFRQIDGSLNRRAGGTGLGMPITKKLVELHGGKIWVESVQGEGTTFWFTIPLTQELARQHKTGPLPELSTN